MRSDCKVECEDCISPSFLCSTAVLVARFEFHSVQVICLSEQVMDNRTLSFDNHDHVTCPLSRNTMIIHSTLARQKIIPTMSVFIARSNRSNNKPISQHEARNLLHYSTVHTSTLSQPYVSSQRQHVIIRDDVYRRCSPSSHA